MNRRSTWILVLLLGSFLVLLVTFAGLAYVSMRQAAEERGHGYRVAKGAGGKHGPRIGVIELTGTIGDEQGGIAGAPEAEQIRDFAQDEHIDAILVRIDSPGGAVAPSQEIWEEIRRARQSKRVVCSQGNIAASGGYYISVACDEIVANPGTLTGSIGVISEFFEASELLDLTRVRSHTVKTGALKDAGNPLRAFTDEDRAYFEALQQNIFEQFLQAVAEGRHRSLEEVRRWADGRVFTGVEAQKLGLIDALGNFRTAVDRLMTLAELEGEPELVYPDSEDETELLWKLLRDGSAATRWGEGLARGAVRGVLGAGAAADAASSRSGFQLMAPGWARHRPD